MKTILSNHLYQFDGRVYKQQSGGPIGLEITGVLARCAMLWWDRAYLKKLDQLKIDILLYLRYVDDSNLVLRALEPGTRFVNNQLSILKEAEEDDRGVPPDERTAKVLRTIANTVIPMIRHASSSRIHFKVIFLETLFQFGLRSKIVSKTSLSSTYM